MGTAPWSITTRVWSDVPDAIFVSAQAASNCTNNHPCHKLLTRRPDPYFKAIALQHIKFHIFLPAKPYLQLGVVASHEELHESRYHPC